MNNKLKALIMVVALVAAAVWAMYWQRENRVAENLYKSRSIQSLTLEVVKDTPPYQLCAGGDVWEIKVNKDGRITGCTKR